MDALGPIRVELDGSYDGGQATKKFGLDPAALGYLLPVKTETGFGANPLALLLRGVYEAESRRVGATSKRGLNTLADCATTAEHLLRRCFAVTEYFSERDLRWRGDVVQYYREDLTNIKR